MSTAPQDPIALANLTSQSERRFPRISDDGLDRLVGAGCCVSVPSKSITAPTSSRYVSDSDIGAISRIETTASPGKIDVPAS